VRELQHVVHAAAEVQRATLGGQAASALRRNGSGKSVGRSTFDLQKMGSLQHFNGNLIYQHGALNGNIIIKYVYIYGYTNIENDVSNDHLSTGISP